MYHYQSLEIEYDCILFFFLKVSFETFRDNKFLEDQMHKIYQGNYTEQSSVLLVMYVYLYLQ